MAQVALFASPEYLAAKAARSAATAQKKSTSPRPDSVTPWSTPSHWHCGQ